MEGTGGGVHELCGDGVGIDPADLGVLARFAVFGFAGPTTWLTWAELEATDWQETDASGTRSRAAAAGTDTDWGRVWRVMSVLSEVHGLDNVRLVVWFR